MPVTIGAMIVIGGGPRRNYWRCNNCGVMGDAPFENGSSFEIPGCIECDRCGGTNFSASIGSETPPDWWKQQPREDGDG